MDKLGIIESIETLNDFMLGNIAKLEGGNGSSLGFSGMINTLCGGRSMDGYKVKTSEHEILVLIDNGQLCCEDWGYFSSDDDLSQNIGGELLAVELTDTALNVKAIEERFEYGFDSGGIQFVTFKTNRGDFQLAVYNAHNGYYGHGIIVAKDGKILCDDTL